ncbi:hypothetical protein E2C01_090427 [Portunus trituberculatus]|uniref:Uncharacterized protein n=1 Tax=Portunus trituberculatus TaxID=210409 RepID=A0A5B7JLS9_PORTR|nr:hypothetical protein [Portunus trituberculatus]
MMEEALKMWRPCGEDGDVEKMVMELVKEKKHIFYIYLFITPTYTRTVDGIRTRVLGDPSDPKARRVPLYHGGPNSELYTKKSLGKLVFGEVHGQHSPITASLCAGYCREDSTLVRLG